MKKLNNSKCNPWRVLFLSFCVVLLIVTLTSCQNNEMVKMQDVRLSVQDPNLALELHMCHRENMSIE